MKYYMAGIKGAGMSALALLLSDLGFDVVGYDDAKEHRFTEDKLLERGIKIYYSSSDGKSREYAEILSENLKKISPTPENVTSIPNNSFVELLNTSAPSVVISVGNQNNEEDVIWFSEALNEIAENIAFSVNEILGIPEIPIPMTAIGIVNTSSGYATVRKSPSPKSRIITRIQNGAPVRIIGKLGNWYAIIAANVEGYILENEIVAETPEKP